MNNTKKGRQSSVKFIESESSYVKVDNSCKSSVLDNWNSIQHLQSQSMMNSKIDHPDQSQNIRKNKMKQTFNSKMELINSQSKIKDLLNSVVKKIFGVQLDKDLFDDNLYLFVTKNISNFNMETCFEYLDFLLNEQESIW